MIAAATTKEINIRKLRLELFIVCARYQTILLLINEITICNRTFQIIVYKYCGNRHKK